MIPDETRKTIEEIRIGLGGVVDDYNYATDKPTKSLWDMLLGGMFSVLVEPESRLEDARTIDIKVLHQNRRDLKNSNGGTVVFGVTIPNPSYDPKPTPEFAYAHADAVYGKIVRDCSEFLHDFSHRTGLRYSFISCNQSDRLHLASIRFARAFGLDDVF